MSETISLTPYKKPKTLDLEALDAEVVEAAEFPVQLSDKALQMVRAALDETEGEDGEYLRVGVKGGGCAGFQYSLNFTDDLDEDDIITQIEGVGVITDLFSASYLEGTELDYVETLQGAGFKFVNPNARRTCGCGSSFS
jgi:iron-sulfur cluster assembly accessory protein